MILHIQFLTVLHSILWCHKICIEKPIGHICMLNKAVGLGPLLEKAEDSLWWREKSSYTSRSSLPGGPHGRAPHTRIENGIPAPEAAQLCLYRDLNNRCIDIIFKWNLF